MNKEAAHQHDRAKERLGLSPQNVDAIQKSIDRMWYSSGRKKLTDNNYYSRIKDPRSNLLGFAVMKKVGPQYNSRLILASILNKDMKPKGHDISSFFETKLHDNNVDMYTPKFFPGMPELPNNK